MRSIWRADRFEVSMSRSEFTGWLIVSFMVGSAFTFVIAAMAALSGGVH